MSRISAPFPERVGWYELLAPIGAGGMATVYLGVAARSGGFQRYVAVKMIHGTAEADAQLAADLLKEAKLVAKIRHPNVVPVIDVGEDPNGLFLVMEYIEGDNLSALRRAAKRAGVPIPEPIALRIVVEALAGLHAAHELKDSSGQSLGVVHRDFSPQNILVGTDGVSRLTDFGIAKVAYTAGHTRTGKIKGKIAYMAPEQARGTKVDQRCDVWAAGVVAWEALVGERLYDTEDEIGALLKIVNEEPPRLRSVRPDLPQELDDALSWAITRDLGQRCPSADALRRRLLGAFPVADTAEVAEFVRQIIGPKLLEREKKIEEIRRLRGQLGELGEAMRENVVSPSTGLDAPSGAFRAATAVTETEQVPQHPREDTTGATYAWKEQDSEAVAPLGTTSITASVEKRVAALLADRRNRAAVIGVVSGLLISAMLMLIILVSVRRSPSEPVRVQPVLAVSQPQTAPPPTEAPTEAPTAPPVVSVAPPAPKLMLRANAAIATLKIAGETLQVRPGQTTVELDERPAVGSSVEAVAADGRRISTKVPASGDVLSLEFPRRSVQGGSQPVAPPPSTGASPFAANPYKKK
ncbi:MAG: protein kinase [Myxococcales bacterium]|nr:protein kinase [Myxococcales bacterium]